MRTVLMVLVGPLTRMLSTECSCRCLTGLDVASVGIEEGIQECERAGTINFLGVVHENLHVSFDHTLLIHVRISTSHSLFFYGG